MVIVGNLLHRDAVLNRFKEKIESGEKDGSFHEFPLVKDGVILWPRKFKTMADIEALRRKVADEATFQREFMLYLMPTCEQVIFKEWMKYIDNIPEGAVLKEILLSMDLAVSESQKADYTTIVTGMIFTLDGEEFLFIHPYPINEKLTFPETVSKIQELYNRPGSENQKQTVLIEEVGYQKALTQQLRSECPDMNIEPVSPKGDKRARLALSGQAIRSGKVWFPTFGIKDLENQILDFGVEKHDDLADAFSQMVIYFSERNKKMGTVTIELLRF
jgi:phage terminase large subunit-like protein